MTRRDTLTEATEALSVRQVRELAARFALQAPIRAARESEARLEQSRDILAQVQTSWAEALGARSLDVSTIRLWQAQEQQDRLRVTDAERQAGEANEALVRSREAWSDQLKRLQAAETVRDSARRTVQRWAEERQLSQAEDLLPSRRRL